MSREPGTFDHEHVEELLAGYALRSLSGEDAVEADRLFSEHVPGCARCRDTLLAFTDTVADLGLAVDPVVPPDTLLPRLRRELEPRASRSDARRRVGLVAGFVAVLVTGGLALSQGLRASDLQERIGRFTDALSFSQRPGADNAPLVEAEDSEPAPMTELTAPDAEVFYLMGRDVPTPPAGTVYGVWLSDGESAVYAGSFLPDEGLTVVPVPFDRSRFDEVLVTIEAEDSAPSRPGEVLWEAAA
jgi:hypothetical protein